ncbi:MAG: MerR family transcriptional regulator [Alphaproteobacteria bacterium]|nr:MerR family transcriptional regulator [Alphaproteobacteria bacterium]
MIDKTPLNLFGEAAKPASADKSRKAYKTISEAAGELGVATHVLRFWESKFTQIQPMKRGGGRRYYDKNAMAILYKIKKMLHDEGYTIKGLQAFFEKGGTASVVSEERDARTDMENMLRNVLSDLKDIRDVLHA